MTEFELECWMWNNTRVTTATVRAGLVPTFWPDLEGAAEELFLMAFSRIQALHDRIAGERAQDKK